MANSVDPDQTAPVLGAAVCFCTLYVSNVRQLFAAGDFEQTSKPYCDTCRFHLS